MAVIRSGGPRRRTAVLAAIGLVAVTVLAGPFMSPAQAIVDDIFDGASQGLEDVDTRVGSVAPTAAQRSAVSGLGATARWNRFGTPQSLIRYGGYLATGLSRDPEAAARAFLNRNRAIFRLTTAQISALELVSEQRMAQSDGVAVLLRQRFGDLPAAVDGMVTVGVVGGRVAYASSSLAPTTAAPQAASLSAVDAWLEAAENVGRTVAGGADRDESVRAAELEVFGFDSTTRPPGDPIVVTTMTGPATARPGSTVTYSISYTNLGPQPSANAMVTDVLPSQLSFVSATRGGTYTAATRTVRWGLGTVGTNVSGTLSLTARIGATVPIGTTIVNQAQFSGALTFSPPAAAVTTVVP